MFTKGIEFTGSTWNDFSMHTDNDLELEYGRKTEPTISFRLDPNVKKLYDELRYSHGVKNLSKICRETLTEVILKAAKQVKSKAG